MSYASHPHKPTMEANGLPTISPAPAEKKGDMTAQYQQLMANAASANAMQQLLLFNSLTNPLAAPLLANSLSNPILQAQMMANGLLSAQMGTPNPLQSQILLNSLSQVNPLTPQSGQPFIYPSQPQFEIGSDDSKKRKIPRKRALKMAQNFDTKPQAIIRPRDEEGRFTSSKVQKTDTLGVFPSCFLSSMTPV